MRHLPDPFHLMLMRGAEPHRDIEHRAPAPASHRAAVLVIVALLLTSCTSADSDEVDNPLATVGAGTPSPDLIRWVGGYCLASGTPEQLSRLPLVTPTELGADPASVIAQTAEYVREEARLNRELAVDVAALGELPIGGGDRIAQHYVDSYEAAAQARDELADSIDAIDAAGSDALTRLVGAIERFGQTSIQLSASVGSPEQVGGRELRLAFDQAPECAPTG